MFLDYIAEILKSGGWVLGPIFLVGALGFYLVGLTITEMGRDYFRRNTTNHFDEILKNITNHDLISAKKMLRKKPGILATSIELAIDNVGLQETDLRNHLSHKINYNMRLLDRHLPMISILAAVAPLLGLLGTVSGMVHTFEVITEFGNSNPVLLADGISEALMTTQSGLLIAFPLVLFKHQLEDHISQTKKQVELRITQFINNWYHTREG